MLLLCPDMAGRRDAPIAGVDVYLAVLGNQAATVERVLHKPGAGRRWPPAAFIESIARSRRGLADRQRVRGPVLLT
jgi:hypothetical protein